MAFNSSSTSLFAGLVVNQATGTTPASVTIPLTSINNITATNAEDNRLLIQALNEQFIAWYNALPSVDKPTKATFSKQVNVNQQGVARITYNTSFIGAIPNFSLSAES